jgi:hypothetical protein
MKALPPPSRNELDDLKLDVLEVEAAQPATDPPPPCMALPIDMAVLQALSAATAADTRALLEEAMAAYDGGDADPAWLDAVLGVFE